MNWKLDLMRCHPQRGFYSSSYQATATQGAKHKAKGIKENYLDPRAMGPEQYGSLELRNRATSA